LTATFRKERLKIDAAWTVNGYGPFGKGQVYLQDGKNTYKGRNEAFVKAAERETPFFGARPAISSVGIGEILKVIGQRRGQLA
jgi:hypothetical protein